MLSKSSLFERELIKQYNKMISIFPKHIHDPDKFKSRLIASLFSWKVLHSATIQSQLLFSASQLFRRQPTDDIWYIFSERKS